jgi:hypothetical protein
MKIVAKYNFSDPALRWETNFPQALSEIEQVIASVQASPRLTSTSGRPPRNVFSPIDIEKEFQVAFLHAEWYGKRIECEYPSRYYLSGYKPDRRQKDGFRNMDFVKYKVGVEVQFGKYPYMIYSAAPKMIIFHNHALIDAGVVIVPVKELADQLHPGVSYFEQFSWDLEQVGNFSLGVPVLVLGVLA